MTNRRFQDDSSTSESTTAPGALPQSTDFKAWVEGWLPGQRRSLPDGMSTSSLPDPEVVAAWQSYFTAMELRSWGMMSPAVP